MSKIKVAAWDAMEDCTLEDALNGIFEEFEAFIWKSEEIIEEAKQNVAEAKEQNGRK